MPALRVAHNDDEPPLDSGEKPGLGTLSSEILLEIFERMYDLDPSAVFPLQTLSRRLGRLATKVAYGHLTLNETLTTWNAHWRYPAAFDHIRAHTHHVVARSDLDLEGVITVLENVGHLETMSWEFVPMNRPMGIQWTPLDALDQLQPRFASTKVIVENMPLVDFTNDFYLSAFPAAQLSSLEVINPGESLNGLGALKTLVVKAPSLEKLHIRDMGCGARMEFKGDERVPPLNELFLKSYNWKYSPAEVARHWDFSKTKTLGLESVSTFNFFSSVDLASLSRLEHLWCDDYVWRDPDKRLEATRMLGELVGTYIETLRSLDLVCHIDSFPFDAIIKHGTTLETLALRDHVDPRTGERLSSEVHLAQVTALARGLPHLRHLELDLAVPVASDAETFVGALGSFPQLETLKLHLRTTLEPLYTITPEVTALYGRYGYGWYTEYDPNDPDAKAVSDMVEQLVNAKHTTTLSFVPKWKTVSIDVCGWYGTGLLRKHVQVWNHVEGDRLYSKPMGETGGGSSGRGRVVRPRSAGCSLPAGGGRLT